VTGISSWRPGFSPMVVHVEFKVFWSVMGQIFFSEHFVFPLPVIIPPVLHVDLSLGGLQGSTMGHGTKGLGLTVFLIEFDFCETWVSRSFLHAYTTHF